MDEREILFPAVERVRDVMESYPGDYWIAGGWAVDLFHGRMRRPHGDIEISIPHHDHLKLADYFTGWTFRYAHDHMFYPWDGVTPLYPDIHELHLTGPDGDTLEVLLDTFDDKNWIYRRDACVTMPRGAFPARGGAFPIGLVLLFKSKNPRDKDTQDFINIWPKLTVDQQAWLKQVLPPGHPWRQVV